MTNIKVNFDRIVTDMKPMHSVNNGPVHKFAADQRISNLEYYAAAGIPFARTHDAAFSQPMAENTQSMYTPFSRILTRIRTIPPLTISS